MVTKNNKRGRKGERSSFNIVMLSILSFYEEVVHVYQSEESVLQNSFQYSCRTPLSVLGTPFRNSA